MDYSTFKVLKGIRFGVYTPNEIKNLSVLEITNTEILDSLGHPTTGGLHDLRLGPNERDDSCETCGLNFYQCPGHSGHITFPVPVYNPVFFPRLYQLLRGSCMHCHKLLAPTSQLYLALYQLQALDYGLVSTVKELAEVISDTSDQSVTNFDDVSVIQTKLKKKFEEAIEGLNLTDMKQPVRSVVECKREILKNFTSKYMMKISGKCPHCKRDRKKISRYHMRLIYVDSKRINVSSSRSSPSDKGDEDAESLTSELSKKEITPDEARQHLHALWENDKIFLQYLFKILYQENKNGELSIDMFFMDVMMVPPSKFRRLNVLKGKKYADSQTTILNEILKDCHLIRSFSKFVKQTLTDESEKDVITKLPGKNNQEKYSFLYQQLQKHVNELFDSDTNKSKTDSSKGIKQILEKKEGLFRMNMMGKRVNYAARSVISPDPYINVNEIGIPMVFAKKLTYPEPVNQWNYEKLRLAVKNGPNIHPGATLVEYENGRIVRLTDNDPTGRQAIANTLLTSQASIDVKKHPAKIVHRHLRDGDMLLLNRQPTLHKPSIMAHKAKVLPGEKTLRLHYANCKSYNADFDGDEMNAHLPQSYLGQSECRHIVNVNHQYLVPKDGTALSGLIQDHIISGTLLTIRGNFFKKDAYHNCILSSLPILPKKLKFLPPAIIKPEPLWSGKQIVSTVIINLIPDGKEPPTVEGKTKVSSKKWLKATPRPWTAGGSLKGDSMSESEVVIRGGELLCGVIDKGQVGPSSYSLIHVCYELYGGETSSMMLTCLARLFTFYLQTYCGFSMGIEDIIVTKKADKQRKKILKKAPLKGREATAKAFEVENPSNEEIEKKYKDAHFNRDDFGLKVLDMSMKEVTQDLSNDVKDACMPNGLVKKFPENNLQLMIESGAKGSMVNALQISCLLGQIELEGCRMPLMLNGSTLPSYDPYDTSPAAGGFVSGRFLTGINDKGFFFHCMAGREGLIDTAVKTSRSGYLQRCMIKHLEGITVNYDLTVRDSDGTVIQFLYGEDGLDVLKMQMMKEESLHLLAENYSSAVNEDHVQAFKSKVEVDLPKLKKQIKRWKNKHPDPRTRKPLIEKLPESSKCNITRRLQMLDNLRTDVDARKIEEFKKANKACQDPVNAQHRPDLVFGSVSEQMDEIISNYIDKNLKTTAYNFSDIKNPKKLKDEDKLKDMFYYQALRSLAEPGETVGLLAAQSIGEPSTQMTLNTFHFAGKGEMNVTLGIPRLREILMTASPNIATPTMDLPLLDKPGVEEKAEKLRLKLNPVSLKSVLDAIKVKESFSINRNSMFQISIICVIRMEFLKHSVYKGYLYTTPAKILYYVERVFVKKLIEAIKRKRRQTSASTLIDSQQNYSGFNRMSRVEESMGENAPVPDGPKVEEGDSSGAESDGDGDATSAKSKMRHDQELEYQDPEEEEMIPEESEDENESGEVEVKEEIQTDEDRENEHFSLPQNVRKSSKKAAVTDEAKAFRINTVKTTHPYVRSYDFDSKSERWCEISLQLDLDNTKIDIKTLLEEEVAKAFVHSVPNIKEALLVKNPNSYQSGCKMMLKTNGVNFLEVFKHVDILDINKAYSNNIHSIAEIYGIEAAAKAVKKEIMNVFKSYNIVVDPRHLSLISDYMTSSGYYRPCNRIGMEGSASPLQQMTFETTKNFLVDAMLMGVEERLKGPSANIVVGQLYHGGTGGFDLFAKIKKSERKKKMKVP